MLYTIVFCICVKYHKAPECATIDIWNVLSFLVVSIAAILLVIPMRVRSLHNAIQLEYLSTHDLFTGLKNRNCFEQVLLQYENQQNTTLCCIYMDANGLHHINNTLGHGAGDTMLKAVATSLQDVFGKNVTYRIGGDEFVVLSDSLTLEDASSGSDQVRTVLQAQGYQLSLGIVKGAGSKEDMPKTVIKAAEKKMYADKSSFYRTSGIDRRRS